MLTLVMFAGMMRHSDGTLHYFVDGVDQGPAFEGLPQYVYPVIDLYGQCAQVCNFVKTLLVILYLNNMLFKSISYSRFSRQNFFCLAVNCVSRRYNSWICGFTMFE